MLIWEIAEILGPFKLDDPERPTDATRGQLIRAWLMGWLRRPREALSFGDWMPHGGRIFPLDLVTLVLVVGGAGALFSPGQGYRLGGAMALSGGVLLLLIIAGYVKRPVGGLISVGAKFPTAWRGYKRADVEQAFATLDTLSPDQIRELQFAIVRSGYDIDAVDRALDEAERSRSM